jgi:hypothetical protein
VTRRLYVKHTAAELEWMRTISSDWFPTKKERVTKWLADRMRDLSWKGRSTVSLAMIIALVALITVTNQ